MTSSNAPSNGRVLFADDEHSVRLVSERMLQRSGYDVVLAADGASALEQISGNGPFDLFLLDINMPGLSCSETLERVRASAPSLPIVLCSGLTGEEEELQPVRALAQGFLQKPFRYQELLDAVRLALD